MFWLFFSLIALRNVSGELQAGPLAGETDFELPMPGDPSGAETLSSDDLGILAADNGEKHGAYIERVDLSKCEHYDKYMPWFYGGMVVNSRAWILYKNEERFTSMAIVRTDGSVISASSGAWPAKRGLIYHTWEMLHFGATAYQDIQTTSPGTLQIQSWNAGQQIYVPLYLADAAKGRAYMLHIYPEPAIIGYPGDWTYADGLLWARGNTNRLYRFDLDLEGLIRNATAFKVPNYMDFIKSWGIVRYKDGNQKQVVYSDLRHIDVQGLTLGSATNYICRDSLNQMDMSWKEFKAILTQRFKWL